MHFATRRRLFGKTVQPVKAVDDVSLTIKAGETVSIVGESGSGKSTTGYAVLGFQKPTAGEVFFEGQDISTLSADARSNLAKRMQIIYQDPPAALDPRFTLEDSIGEPLLLHGMRSRQERASRVGELLDAVGLAPSLAKRYPHQVSGGQKQRVVIARAIALNPALIICDEAVSALDVSIRSQILNLLMDLQARLNLAYLFISHDLSVVRHISDRVLVMRAGKIVEQGPTDVLFASPQHEYTQTLLRAIPMPDPLRRRFGTVRAAQPGS
ncbi:MAG: ABC transporter ATP-binding protein [Cupriavidus sp.]|nr:ABC transporter ATP-binding protein [Cupriavidus sp.]